MFNSIVILICSMIFSCVYSMESERPSIEKKSNIFIKDMSKSDSTKPTQRRFSLPEVSLSRKSSPSESPSQSPNISPRKEVIKVSAPRKPTKGDTIIKLEEWFSNNIWDAIKKNEKEKVLIFLQPNLNAVDQYGKTLLIMAIREQYIEYVAALLKHENIDVNLADKLGNTPLHRAVLVKSEVLILMLLKHFRINSLIKNEKALFPKEYTEDAFYNDKMLLKTMFDLRADLENCVDTEVENLQLMGLKSNLDFYDKQLNTSLSNVKLTCGIFLPEYASNDFIKNMILYRLKLKNNEHAVPIFSITI